MPSHSRIFSSTPTTQCTGEIKVDKKIKENIKPNQAGGREAQKCGQILLSPASHWYLTTKDSTLDIILLSFRRNRVGGSQRDQTQRRWHNQQLEDLHQDPLPGEEHRFDSHLSETGTVREVLSQYVLFQELAEFMGLAKLVARTRDATLQMCWEGLLPRDNPRDTRY